MANKSVVIVGAGPGGLASAMLLAHRGFRVQVFEKASRIGGRTAEVALGPYRFDLGPTFLMMRYLLDDLFRDAGRETSAYLDLLPLDPLYRLNFLNKSMLVHSDPTAMRDEIERVLPGEGAGFERFLEAESVRFRKLYPCLQKDYDSPLAYLNTTLIAALPHIAIGQSLYDVLSKYFRSEELRLAFTFQSKYLGMSPWDCPGLFAMIPYTEHAHGIYHVMGGLSKIPAAFAKAAVEDGAEIHTSCGVRQVLVDEGKAYGVLLENGEKVYADEVVINADFGHAITTLFPGENLGKYRPEALAKREFSCSTFMIYVGLDKTYPDAEHHLIVFAEDYRKCLESITKTKTLTDDLSVYVRNAVTLDPSCAPEGHSALYILAPVPNNTSCIDWEAKKAAFRDSVLDLLAARTPYKDIREHIQAELIVTPADWEKNVSVYLGATFNMSHSWNQMLYFRPHNKFELFDGVYLVGGGTHPGSGLPTIFESARISSNLISDKYGVDHVEPTPFAELGIA